MENKSLKNGDIVSFEHNGKKLVGSIIELSYNFSYKVKVGHDHYIVNISDLESDKPAKKAGRPPKDSKESKDKKKLQRIVNQMKRKQNQKVKPQNEKMIVMKKPRRMKKIQRIVPYIPQAKDLWVLRHSIIKSPLF